MKFVYVASPYSHEDKGIMTRRSHQALEFVARYYNRPSIGYGDRNLAPEYFLYSPIAYMAQAERDYGLPSDFEFWQQLDEACIRRFDEMWVLMIDGIEASTGVRSEVAYAQALDTYTPIKLVWPKDPILNTTDYFCSLTKELAEEFGWDWVGKWKVNTND